MGGSKGGGGGGIPRSPGALAGLVVNPVQQFKTYTAMGEKILNPGEVNQGVQAPPPVPGSGDAETVAKQNAAAGEERKSKSRAATILTGGGTSVGLESAPKASVSRRTLLGS